MQRTGNSQNNFEKQQSYMTYITRLKNTLQNNSNQDSVVLVSSAAVTKVP